MTVLHKRGPSPIVLDKYKAIYIPIPINASTSLKFYLSDILGMGVKNQIHTANFHYIDREDLASDKYKSFFKFTFVRNPYTRVVSCFCKKIAKERTNRGPMINGVTNGFYQLGGFFGGMSFEQFVERINQVPDQKADPHFRSQYDFIYDSNGNCLVDYVGRFECLDEGLSSISDRMGLPKRILDKRGASNRAQDYNEYYSQDTIDQIGFRYKKDLMIFGYSFINKPSIKPNQDNPTKRELCG